ncbi:hypothetical protein ACQUQU_01450 [Thalassolituus sp. LLYu03]|uniref:hypothetical protein n=1 Tax=Thalassolituus sp. LLYu03 TaxID=3421656 RepID=UPI003D2A45E8
MSDVGGDKKLFGVVGIYNSMTLSVLVFLLASIFLCLFSPEFLHGLMPTKINRLVLAHSGYAKLQISAFFGAILSTILMAPYLLVRSSRNRIRYLKYLSANSNISFMGFFLCLIIGINQCVLFDGGTWFGRFVVESPVDYFIFIVFPILLYQLLFRYFFSK